MISVSAKWMSYNGYSGVSYHGTNDYVAPKPAKEWDVVTAAIARPEGGSWDMFNAYDGTGVTWGLAQWTATSGRLQKLLSAVANVCSSYDSSGVDDALKSSGLKLNRSTGYFEDLNGKPITDKDRLRDLLTPPGGNVPRTGSKWDLAVKIANAFHVLGQDHAVEKVQQTFLIDELKKEAGLKRPMLLGKTINEYLGYPADSADPYLTATRALFWSCWQNAPRAAEEHLRKAWHSSTVFNGVISMKQFGTMVATSTFANWGNRKAAQKGRESRYHKMATQINKVMEMDLFDPDLR